MHAKVSKFTPDMIGKVVEVSVTGNNGESLEGLGRLESVQVTPTHINVRFTGETQPFSIRWVHELTARIDAYDF